MSKDAQIPNTGDSWSEDTSKTGAFEGAKLSRNTREQHKREASQPTFDNTTVTTTKPLPTKEDFDDLEQVRIRVPEAILPGKVSLIDGQLVVHYRKFNLDPQFLAGLQSHLQQCSRLPVLLRYKFDPAMVQTEIRRTLPEGLSFRNISYQSGHRMILVNLYLPSGYNEDILAWQTSLEEQLGITLLIDSKWLNEPLMVCTGPNGILRDPTQIASFLQGSLPLRYPGPIEISSFLPDRTDLRDLVCLTIDPEGACDLDDALSVFQRSDGVWIFGVHIADPTALISPKSLLDQQARQRGFNVYGRKRIVPILPEEISYGKASLISNEDRLAWSFIVELSSRGELLRYSIKRSVIRSQCQLSYEQIENILAGEPHPLFREIYQLYTLSQLLRATRLKRGSLSGELASSHHAIVEEYMLLANKIAAQFLQKHGVPFLYRVHPTPTNEQWELFAAEMAQYNQHVYKESLTNPLTFRFLINQLIQQEGPEAVTQLFYQSTGRAYYATTNAGHFGLGFDCYGHFTSPIRRYVDMVNHRQLASLLCQETPLSHEDLEKLQEHLNNRAQETEKESSFLATVEAIDSYLRWHHQNIRGRVTDLENGKVKLFIEGEESISALLERSNIEGDHLLLPGHSQPVPWDPYQDLLMSISGFHLWWNKPLVRLVGLVDPLIVY